VGILNPKKKKKEELQAPKWFKIMMVGFVAYAIIASLFSDKVSDSKKVADAKLKAAGPQFVFAPLAPTKDGGRDLPLFGRDRAQGDGAEAGCWETVEISYKLYNNKNELVEDRMTAESEPMRFTLGLGDGLPALERGVLGMKPGGRREITARPELAFGAPGFTHEKLTDKDQVAFDVVLKSVERPANLPFSDLGLRIYDDVKGKGRIAQCTDPVGFRLRGWKADGETLWRDQNISEKTFETTIGRGVAPYAIEKALIGLQLDGKRTLIVAPGYGRPLFAEDAPTEENKNEPYLWEGLPIPQDEVILLEIERVPLPSEMPTEFVQPAKE